MFRIIKATLIGKLSRDLEYDSPTSKPVKVRISKIKASRGIGPNAEELGSFAARIIFTRSAHPENFRRQTSVPIYPAALPPAIDLEFSGYNDKQRPSPKESQRELAVFWDAIFAHYRKTPVVYTTADFQKKYLAQMPRERL